MMEGKASWSATRACHAGITAHKHDLKQKQSHAGSVRLVVGESRRDGIAVWAQFRARILSGRLRHDQALHLVGEIYEKDSTTCCFRAWQK